MTNHERTRQIAAAFQASFKRDNRDDIEAISLQELRDTDASIGNRDLNDGYRIRLRQRISDLEEATREIEKKRKWLKDQGATFAIGLLSGIAVSAISYYLFGK